MAMHSSTNTVVTCTCANRACTVGQLSTIQYNHYYDDNSRCLYGLAMRCLTIPLPIILYNTLIHLNTCFHTLNFVIVTLY